MQPRYAVKWQSCEVCGREYAMYPFRTKRGAIRYRGECHCGGLDCHDDGQEFVGFRCDQPESSRQSLEFVESLEFGFWAQDDELIEG